MAEHTSSSTLGGTPGADFSTSKTSPQSGSGIGLVDRVKEQATAKLSSQKEKATDGLGTVASAVRQTTQSLRDQQHDTVAGYVEQAADQIERLSERLKNKDVSELLNDAQRLARQQPALFVGGAFALGLIGARFLKSSSSRDDDEYSRDTYGSYGSTSEAYGTARSRPNIGTTGSTGDLIGTRSSSNLGATGASGYTSPNYGTSPSTPGTSSSVTGSKSGSTGNRDDRERF